MPNCRKKVAAYVGLRVCRYNRTDTNLTASTATKRLTGTENDQQGGAEAGRYGEESTNKKQVVKNTRRPIL